MTDAAPMPGSLSNILIRDARRGDLDAIAGLQSRAMIAFGIATYGEEACRAWARMGVQVRHTLLKSGTFFVAEKNGSLAGVAGWTMDSREPDCAWLRYVFVDPAHAKLGIGRKLTATAERSAREAGRSRLMLWASLNAVDFYDGLGYRRVRSARWPVADGIEMDHVLMEKAPAAARGE